MASTHPPSPTPMPPAPPENRRSFFTVASAVVAGGIAFLTPLAAGVATFVSPLFRRRESSKVRVALLDQSPDDGVPRYFSVIADREDAWNRYPAQRVGAVYLVRAKGAQAPIAFTAKCPHAGCFIGYTPGDDCFKCPCHTSEFKLDGARVHGDAEVAPRAMDELNVELREAKADGGAAVTEVWVEFVDYETGRKERIPTA